MPHPDRTGLDRLATNLPDWYWSPHSESWLTVCCRLTAAHISSHLDRLTRHAEGYYRGMKRGQQGFEQVHTHTHSHDVIDHS